ncbi:MAG: tetratricopeptide repeat protein [Clostridia bacterium]|nr:tetratricopeptide repeat protein [Clostridia bacterium]
MSLAKNEAMRARLLVSPDLDVAKAALDEEKSVENWYNYAMALGRLGKDKEAIDAYCQGLFENPFAPMLYFGRGRRYMGPKKYDRALADFTMSIRLDPEVYSFWYYHAVTNNLAGNYEAAIYDFRRAMEQTQPFERYGLIDWQFTSYVEMGDMEKAKAVLDEIDDDLEAPQMHYGYKRRVRLYKGLISPEEFIDVEDIKKHLIQQDNRLQLEITTLLFGLYIYYIYKGEEEKANETLLEILKDPYKGAFGAIKAEDAAKARGLI